MALKTRTQTHQTKDVTALHSMTHDSHFSWRIFQLLSPNDSYRFLIICQVEMQR